MRATLAGLLRVIRWPYSIEWVDGLTSALESESMPLPTSLFPAAGASAVSYAKREQGLVGCVQHVKTCQSGQCCVRKRFYARWSTERQRLDGYSRQHEITANDHTDAYLSVSFLAVQAHPLPVGSDTHAR